ncbi:MAG: hypothetical protein QM820_65085 [Minicystis sp.]
MFQNRERLSGKFVSRALLIVFVGLAVMTGCVAVGEVSPTDADPWFAGSVDGGELTPPTTQQLVSEMPPAPRRAVGVRPTGLAAPLPPAPDGR